MLDVPWGSVQHPAGHLLVFLYFVAMLPWSGCFYLWIYVAYFLPCFQLLLCLYHVSIQAWIHDFTSGCLCCSSMLDAAVLCVLCWTQMCSASNVSISLHIFWCLNVAFILIHAWYKLHALFYPIFSSLHAYLSGCWAQISLCSLLCLLSVLDATMCCVLCWTQL